MQWSGSASSPLVCADSGEEEGNLEELLNLVDSLLEEDQPASSEPVSEPPCQVFPGHLQQQQQHQAQRASDSASVANSAKHGEPAEPPPVIPESHKKPKPLSLVQEHIQTRDGQALLETLQAPEQPPPGVRVMSNALRRSKQQRLQEAEALLAKMRALSLAAESPPQGAAPQPPGLPHVREPQPQLQPLSPRGCTVPGHLGGEGQPSSRDQPRHTETQQQQQQQQQQAGGAPHARNNLHSTSRSQHHGTGADSGASVAGPPVEGMLRSRGPSMRAASGRQGTLGGGGRPGTLEGGRDGGDHASDHQVLGWEVQGSSMGSGRGSAGTPSGLVMGRGGGEGGGATRVFRAHAPPAGRAVAARQPQDVDGWPAHMQRDHVQGEHAPPRQQPQQHKQHPPHPLQEPAATTPPRQHAVLGVAGMVDGERSSAASSGAASTDRQGLSLAPPDAAAWPSQRAAAGAAPGTAAAGAAAGAAVAGGIRAERQAQGGKQGRNSQQDYVVVDRNGSLVTIGGRPNLHMPLQAQQGVIPASRTAMPHGASSTSGPPAARGAQNLLGPGKARGLQLWTGNRSQAQVVRLGVRLIQATELSRSSSIHVIDPFATVKCEKAKFVTKAIANSTKPYWDEFFVFEVRSPAFAVLRVKVLDHLSCWRPALVGEVRVPVKFLADNSSLFSQPAWHTLHRRRGQQSHGKIQMQCFYLQERVHRPLNVMCCTWNVGNAAPPEDLSPWLKGVDGQVHDLVAIGVQECAYKLRGTGKEEDGGDEDEMISMGPDSTHEHGSMSLSFNGHSRGKAARPSSRFSQQALSTSEAERGHSSVEGAPLASQVGSRISSVTSPMQGTLMSAGSSTEANALAHNLSFEKLSVLQFKGTQKHAQPEQQQQGKRPKKKALLLGRKSTKSAGFAHDTQHKRSLKEVDVGGGKLFQKAWEDRMKAAMGGNYWMARSVHMGQIRLLLFARNDMYAAISHIERGSQATGVGGVATNKGGVAIAVQVWDTELCFINCHLAAHQDKTRARNAHYSDIVKGIRLDDNNMDMLTNYHHVLWMGDLNYRLDYKSQATNPTKSPSPAEHAALVADVEQCRWSDLMATDQLRKEQAAQRTFLRFQEMDILFAPTFKVQRCKGIHYTPQRLPAWCDRVLFRSNLPLKQIKGLEYFQATDITTSDHKPVAATFTVPTVWRQDTHLPSERVHLVLHSISCTGLETHRKRKPGSLETSSLSTPTLPNPQLILMGGCLAGKRALHTSVVHANRSPTWEAAMKLPLKPAAIQELAHRRLLVRVVDVVKEGLGKGQINTLARGVLPLTPVAMALLQSSNDHNNMQHATLENGLASSTPPPTQAPQSIRAEVPLEYNGLPAGMLVVLMGLEFDMETPARKSDSSQPQGEWPWIQAPTLPPPCSSPLSEQSVRALAAEGGGSSGGIEGRGFMARLSFKAAPQNQRSDGSEEGHTARSKLSFRGAHAHRRSNDSKEDRSFMAKLSFRAAPQNRRSDDSEEGRPPASLFARLSSYRATSGKQS